MLFLFQYKLFTNKTQKKKLKIVACFIAFYLNDKKNNYLDLIKIKELHKQK